MSTKPDYAKFAARQRAEFPYTLSYNRQGGRNTGVGLVVGSRVARSLEEAEAIQRRMEMDDVNHGHVTTYSIDLRAVPPAGVAVQED